MNCANFRRNLSDSWLTFTTGIRDRLSLRFARWSFSVYGDPDCDEWLDAIARRAAGQPCYKGRWYRLRGGDTVKASKPHERYDKLVEEHGLPGGPAVPEMWERKEDMAVTFSNVEEFDKWNRGLNPALLEHVKATKDE